MTSGVSQAQRQAINQGREVLYRATQLKHDKVKEAINTWRKAKSDFGVGPQNPDAMTYNRKKLIWESSFDEVNNPASSIEGDRRYHFVMTLLRDIKAIGQNEGEKRAIANFLQHKLLKHSSFDQLFQLTADDGKYKAATERVESLIDKLDNKTFKSSLAKDADRVFGFKLDPILLLRLGQEKFDQLAAKRQTFMLKYSEWDRATSQAIREWYKLNGQDIQIQDTANDLYAIVKAQPRIAETQPKQECLQRLNEQYQKWGEQNVERHQLLGFAKYESRILTPEEVQEVLKVRVAKALTLFKDNQKILGYIHSFRNDPKLALANPPNHSDIDNLSPFEKTLLEEIMDLCLQLKLGQEIYTLAHARHKELWFILRYSDEQNRQFLAHLIAIFSKDTPTRNDPQHVRFEWSALFKSMLNEQDIFTPQIIEKINAMDVKTLTNKEVTLTTQVLKLVKDGVRIKTLQAEIQSLLATGKLPEVPTPPQQTTEVNTQPATIPQETIVEIKTPPPTVAPIQENATPVQETPAPLNKIETVPATSINEVASVAPTVESVKDAAAPVKDAAAPVKNAAAPVKPAVKKLSIWKRIGNCISKWWNKFINLFKRERS